MVMLPVWGPHSENQVFKINAECHLPMFPAVLKTSGTLPRVLVTTLQGHSRGLSLERRISTPALLIFVALGCRHLGHRVGLGEHVTDGSGFQINAFAHGGLFAKTWGLNRGSSTLEDSK